MPNKIGNIEQNYNTLDFQELQNDLALAEVEAMDERTYAIAKYKTTGERPLKIAAIDAEAFGIRKAFWDIYAPIENPSAGYWRLEKDATTGEEVILRKESKLDIGGK